MKSLKKGLFILAFFAVTISASAQFNWGIKAGFNASTIRNANFGMENTEVKYRPGFHVGLMGQYMFDSNLGLETGLYYSTLGVNINAKEGSGKTTMSPSYLQLPLSLLYKIRVGENLSLNPSLGIYAGYGVGGKIKITGTQDENEEYDYFGKDEGEKDFNNRFDMGATAGLTLQFEKFMIGLGYDYGFMKINNNKLEDGAKDVYNGNIKISVGYLF